MILSAIYLSSTSFSPPFYFSSISNLSSSYYLFSNIIIAFYYTSCGSWFIKLSQNWYAGIKICESINLSISLIDLYILNLSMTLTLDLSTFPISSVFAIILSFIFNFSIIATSSSSSLIVLERFGYFDSTSLRSFIQMHIWAIAYRVVGFRADPFKFYYFVSS